FLPARYGLCSVPVCSRFYEASVVVDLLFKRAPFFLPARYGLCSVPVCSRFYKASVVIDLLFKRALFSFLPGMPYVPCPFAAGFMRLQRSVVRSFKRVQCFCPGFYVSLYVHKKGRS
ncbi:hypothetical protein, partial [Mixta calida]|uniref:hypothetical protein n=1 Tax=Mixta calida TaxID=665913 RepID=UPI002FDD28FC